MATLYRQRDEVLLFTCIFLAFLLANSAFNQWHAGWSVGPRYLIPAPPFLSLPLVLVVERIRRTAIGIAGVSALIMLVVTAVDPQVPAAMDSPLREYIFPLMQERATFINGIRIEGPVSANPIGVYESWSNPVRRATLQQPVGTFLTSASSFGPGAC